LPLLGLLAPGALRVISLWLGALPLGSLWLSSLRPLALGLLDLLRRLRGRGSHLGLLDRRLLNLRLLDSRLLGRRLLNPRLLDLGLVELWLLDRCLLDSRLLGRGLLDSPRRLLALDRRPPLAELRVSSSRLHANGSRRRHNLDPAGEGGAGVDVRAAPGLGDRRFRFVGYGIAHEPHAVQRDSPRQRFLIRP
jgi:hypothetical protein